MVVQDLIDCLSCVKDKSIPIYIYDITTGLRYIDIDSIKIDSDVKLIIET